MITVKGAYSTGFVLLALAACDKPASQTSVTLGPPRTPEAAPLVTTFDEYQRKLAERVQTVVAGDSPDPDFQVVAGLIPAPIGTLLMKGRSRDIDACFVTPPDPRPANNLFPSITMARSLSAKIGLDDALLAGLGTFGLSGGDEGTITLSIEAPFLVNLPENALHMALSNVACKKKISGQPSWFVRGYVSGKRTFLTKGKTSGSTEVTGRHVGSMSINYTPSDGNVTMTDLQPYAFLTIVSEVGSTEVAGQASVQVTKPTSADGAGVIYIQRDRADTSSQSSTIKDALQRGGFNVAATIESIPSSRMPGKAQVRYFNQQDHEAADRALAILRTVYPDAILSRNGLPAPLGQIEIWTQRTIANSGLSAQTIYCPAQRDHSESQLRTLPPRGTASQADEVRAAAADGHVAQLQRLINDGADVNAVTGDGQTPLMFAVSNDCVETVRLLLSHGAQRDLVNQYGDTAKSIASQKHLSEISAELSR